MKQVRGDIWGWHRRGYYVGITTNTERRQDGRAVMGKGIALQAAQRFPRLPVEFAATNMKGVHVFHDYKLFTFQTKERWRQPSRVSIITTSAISLMSKLRTGEIAGPVVMVQPGCGNGGLDWYTVYEALDPVLDDEVYIITP